VVRGYCEACKAAGLGKEKRDPDIKRLYGSARWRTRRIVFLDENPLCVGYPKGVHGDRAVAAALPDHIKAHKGDEDLFFDESNWQPLCVPCNSRKAVELEGGGWRRSA
jgi:5-methylcytosine-specific restriction protein A